MSNTLVKYAKVTYLLGSPYVPANPGQPFVPAHTVTETKVVCGFVPATIYTLNGRFWAMGPQTWQCIPTQVTRGVPTQYYVAPTPAVAGVASSVITDYVLGWNASAVSQAWVIGDGFVAFDAPATAIGVLAGMLATNVSPAYAAVSHGLLFSHGLVQVIESGILRTSLGTTVATDRWTIDRALGVVAYLKNGSLVYTSTSIPGYSYFRLTALLYSGNDALNNPALGQEWHGQAALTMRAPMTAGSIGFGTTRHGQARLSLKPLALTGGSAVRAAMRFLPLVVSGGVGSHGTATMTLQPMSVDASSGAPAPEYGIAALSMAYLVVGASGTTGGLLDGNLVMRPLSVNASGTRAGDVKLNHGTARMSMVPMMVGGSAYEGNNFGSMQSFFSTVDTQIAVNNVLVAVSQNMTLASVMTVVANPTATMKSQLAVSSVMSLMMQQMALMQSTLVFSGTVPLFDHVSDTWVLNADTRATSRYANYNFNSMGIFNGRYFGMRADGLYWLDQGYDDAGAPIRASVSGGKHDFDTSVKKRLMNAYIGANTHGTMYLKVVADGIDYIYQARSDGSGTLTETRFDIGKGIRANFIEFDLYNGDGADFELASIEFIAIPTDRRI
jgi:hypothetical protein